jgi:hypothetical protein
MNAKRRTWVLRPDAGGVKIPPAVRTRIAERINRHAQARYAGKFARLDIRFHGVFCYIDAYTEPEEPSAELLKITGETREHYLERLRAAPIHLCRLRYFSDEEAWGLAFYTYSNERYELCVFPSSGSFLGPVEEGFDVGAVYLHGD